MKRVIGRPFQKGQSGNPKGYPGHIPKELREERKANLAGFLKLVSLYCNLTSEQALKRLSGPDTHQIEEMIQGVINKAKEGDVGAFKFILETLVGKIPENNGDEGFTDEDLRVLRRVKELRAEEEKATE